MKIGVYCRVSSEEQRDNTSLDVQKEMGIKFCIDNGFEYEVYSEVVSGVKRGDERNEFRVLEDKVFSGEIDGIWLYDWDRMVRDVDVMLYFRNLVRDSGCKVFVGSEEKNILDDDSLDFGIRSIIGDYERRKILRRMILGRNKRWSEGKGIGKLGFGFESKGGEAKLIEEEVNVVKDIYKYFLYKNVKKYGDCERYLFKKYGREVNGKRLDSGLVSRVLGNKKYNGLLVYSSKKYGDFEIELEKIIDDEIFELVEKKLKYVKGVRLINSKEIFLLKGKVFCGDCDNRMWVEGSGKIVNGKSYRYFRCSSYKENKKREKRGLEKKIDCVSGVRGNKISKGKLDDIVWNCLFRILMNSDLIVKEYKKRFDENLGVKDRFVSKLGYYNKELVKLDDRKNKMINMMLDGKFSEEDYDSWYESEYKEKKDEINEKILSVKDEVKKYGYVDKIESWMDLMKDDLLRDYNIERKEDKKRIIDRYVEKVFVRELDEVEKNKRFEINLVLRLGSKSGKIEFEYDIKRKNPNLKLIEKDFYILNNELVKSRILVYKDELLINIKMFVRYNKCGKYELNINELLSEFVDF